MIESFYKNLTASGTNLILGASSLVAGHVIKSFFKNLTAYCTGLSVLAVSRNTGSMVAGSGSEFLTAYGTSLVITTVSGSTGLVAERRIYNRTTSGTSLSVYTVRLITENMVAGSGCKLYLTYGTGLRCVTSSCLTGLMSRGNCRRSFCDLSTVRALLAGGRAVGGTSRLNSLDFLYLFVLTCCFGPLSGKNYVSGNLIKSEVPLLGAVIPALEYETVLSRSNGLGNKSALLYSLSSDSGATVAIERYVKLFYNLIPLSGKGDGSGYGIFFKVPLLAAEPTLEDIAFLGGFLRLGNITALLNLLRSNGGASGTVERYFELFYCRSTCYSVECAENLVTSSEREYYCE